MPQRLQHTGECLLVDIPVDRQPHTGRQVNVDAARPRPRMPTDSVFLRWRRLGGCRSRRGWHQCHARLAGTAFVTTPYGMNCNGSLAMLAAFRCADRQL